MTAIVGSGTPMNKILGKLVIGLMLTIGSGGILQGQSKLPPCSNELPQSSWDNCEGRFTLTDGDRYFGEWKHGKFNGKGTYTSAANEDKYIGEFKDGKRSWHGTFLAGNGDRYVGEFKDDMFNGQGTYKYRDGDRYVGEFKDDKFNGKGTFFAANGSIISSGKWVDDKLVEVAVDRINMERSGGIFVVPVLINDTITLNFVVDSGAADVSIPADVVLTLMRTGTLKATDFLGQKTYVLADGSKVPSQTFRIRSLKVGDKVLKNVNGSVASVNGSLLLGQSFLGRFKAWSVDNNKHALILE